MEKFCNKLIEPVPVNEVMQGQIVEKDDKEAVGEALWEVSGERSGRSEGSPSDSALKE